MLYWCHASSRQPYETGIPRVVRRLGNALARRGVTIVPVGRNERSGLVEVIGRGPAAFDELMAGSKAGTILFIPDLTVDVVTLGVDPIRIGQGYGLHTTILVHDLIPLKLAAHYTDKTVAAFTKYYESMAHADAVLATTHVVAEDLRGFLSDRGLRAPPIGVVPLPAQFADHPRASEPRPARRVGDKLRLTCVSSWERRKNLLVLLRAVQRARSAGLGGLELTLVGRRGADVAFDAEVDALLAQTPGATAAGELSDGAVAALIAASDATIYPSVEEGFGLPIGESLWLGRPCLCHCGSAMAEVAPGGGTLMIDMMDEAAIADALRRLDTEAELLPRLARETIVRPLRRWDDYANEILGLLFMPLRGTASVTPTRSSFTEKLNINRQSSLARC